MTGVMSVRETLCNCHSKIKASVRTIARGQWVLLRPSFCGPLFSILRKARAYSAANMQLLPVRTGQSCQETFANKRETSTSEIIYQVDHKSLGLPESTVGKCDYDRSETSQKDHYYAPSEYQHGNTRGVLWETETEVRHLVPQMASGRMLVPRLRRTSTPGQFRLRKDPKLLQVCTSQPPSHQWVWIDTCCIDKRNSAELT